MNTKKIEYNFPTSDNAKAFGYYNEGCFVVSVSGIIKKIFSGDEREKAKEEFRTNLGITST